MEALIAFFNRNYAIKQDGSVCKKNGHRASVFDVITEYRHVCEEACVPCDVSEKDLQAYVDENKPATEQKAVLKPVDYINGYLKRHTEWVINSSWSQFEFRRHGTPQNSDIDSLHNDIMAEIYNNGIKLKDSAIKATLCAMQRDASNRAISEIASSFAYSEKCEEAFDRWAAALYDYFKPKQSFEIFKTLWKHWMWQVKRKVTGREVKNHIWINFRGASGLGKSLSLEKIMGPLKEYTVSTTIAKLLDDTREMKKLTESYVINLDELAVNSEFAAPGDETRLKNDQKASLKAILTQSKMQPRLMGGQQQVVRRVTFSCISSANEHLYDIIYDATTMRRFYEFDCEGVRPKSFKEINRYLDNSLYAWRAVNENLEDGYWIPGTEIWDQIAADQARYYPTNTTTGSWINEENIIVGDEKAMDMYEEYRDFCKSHGHLVKNFTNWKIDLSHLVPGSVDADGRVRIAKGPTCA